MSDNVEHPSHYNAGSVETIDGIRAALGDAFMDYCRGNVLKYVWRCRHKGNTLEDLRKAAKYLEWAIEEAESEKPSKPQPLPIPEGWMELEPRETPLSSDMYEHEGMWMKRFDDANCEYEWYDVRHIRKIETDKPGHVEGVWVEEADANASKIEPTEWIPKVGDKVRVVRGFANPVGETGVIKKFCPVVNGNFSMLAGEGRRTWGWFKKDDVELIEAAQ